MGLTIEKTVRSDHMDVLKILYPFVVRMIRKIFLFYEEDDSYLFGHPGFLF